MYDSTSLERTVSRHDTLLGANKKLVQGITVLIVSVGIQPSSAIPTVGSENLLPDSALGVGSPASSRHRAMFVSKAYSSLFSFDQRHLLRNQDPAFGMEPRHRRSSLQKAVYRSVGRSQVGSSEPEACITRTMTLGLEYIIYVPWLLPAQNSPLKTFHKLRLFLRTWSVHELCNIPNNDSTPPVKSLL